MGNADVMMVLYDVYMGLACFNRYRETGEIGLT